MPAIADNLMHFLGRQHKDSPADQFEIFKSIITDGLRCSKIQIKFGDGGIVHNKAVCFTDIPLSECDEHTAVYGKFGIGFKKSFVKRNGGNPVRYFVDYLPGETFDESIIENRGLLYLNLCDHFKFVKLIRDLLNQDSMTGFYDDKQNVIIPRDQLQSLYDQEISILSYEKEMGDLGPARDETKEIDLYYKEREWRLVPCNANIISGSVNYVEQGNDAFYKFHRGDVNVVVAPNDDIRTEILNYLFSFNNSQDLRLKEFSQNPLSIVTYDDLHKW